MSSRKQTSNVQRSTSNAQLRMARRKNGRHGKIRYDETFARARNDLLRTRYNIGNCDRSAKQSRREHNEKTGGYVSKKRCTN